MCCLQNGDFHFSCWQLLGTVRFHHLATHVVRGSQVIVRSNSKLTNSSAFDVLSVSQKVRFVGESERHFRTVCIVSFAVSYIVQSCHGNHTLWYDWQHSDDVSDNKRSFGSSFL